MLTPEVLSTMFWQITSSELFTESKGKLMKADIWQVFYGLLLTETDEEYNLNTLSQETEEMMISSLLAWEKEHGKDPIIQQLFCVITSKSCEE
jgi:hypothetical protein